MSQRPVIINARCRDFSRPGWKIPKPNDDRPLANKPIQFKNFPSSATTDATFIRPAHQVIQAKKRNLQILQDDQQVEPARKLLGVFDISKQLRQLNQLLLIGATDTPEALAFVAKILNTLPAYVNLVDAQRQQLATILVRLKRRNDPNEQPSAEGKEAARRLLADVEEPQIEIEEEKIRERAISKGEIPPLRIKLTPTVLAKPLGRIFEDAEAALAFDEDDPFEEKTHSEEKSMLSKADAAQEQEVIQKLVDANNGREVIDIDSFALSDDDDLKHDVNLGLTLRVNALPGSKFDPTQKIRGIERGHPFIATDEAMLLIQSGEQAFDIRSGIMVKRELGLPPPLEPDPHPFRPEDIPLPSDQPPGREPRFVSAAELGREQFREDIEMGRLPNPRLKRKKERGQPSIKRPKGESKADFQERMRQAKTKPSRKSRPRVRERQRRARSPTPQFRDPSPRKPPRGLTAPRSGAADPFDFDDPLRVEVPAQFTGSLRRGRARTRPAPSRTKREQASPSHKRPKTVQTFELPSIRRRQKKRTPPKKRSLKPKRGKRN